MVSNVYNRPINTISWNFICLKRIPKSGSHTSDSFAGFQEDSRILGGKTVTPSIFPELAELSALDRSKHALQFFLYLSGEKLDPGIVNQAEYRPRVHEADVNLTSIVLAYQNIAG